MTSHLTVFLGYDSHEPLAWMVAAYSILSRASRPVSIVPLTRQSVAKRFTRPSQPNESTEFAITRFLVPALSDFQGYGLFVDCDVLCRVDVHDILIHALVDPGKAVYVVQHDYVPKAATKFNGHVQAAYPKKNWSSVMLFDCRHCEALTVDYVNRASAADLHRFAWLPDDRIGSLPIEWNWLVGEYPENPDAKILHYTNGIPAYPGYESCDQADVWWQEYAAMLKPAQAMSQALDRLATGHA